MEPKFQTSFIPKRPQSPSSVMPGGSTQNRPRIAGGGSIFFSIAILLFLASALGAGGVYVWKYYVLQSADNLKKELSLREKQFNPNLIADLKTMNNKIDNVKKLLDSHLSLSSIFDVVGRFTIERVRFMNFSFVTSGQGVGGQTGGDIKITLNGYGANLSTAAFQSDVLGKLQLYGLKDVIKNPNMSSPALNNGGTVTFGVTASLNPKDFLYSKTFQVDNTSQ